MVASDDIMVRDSSMTMEDNKSFSVLTDSTSSTVPSEQSSKRVRFARTDAVYETEYTLEAADCRRLWYNKRDIGVNRKDIRRTIMFVRDCGGAELFAEKRSLEEEEDLCFRGCERYYNLETRFMSQRTLIDAVLEAQAERSSSTFLRQVSESLSHSCKDLARWHASLNAFHCWGLKGLRKSIYNGEDLIDIGLEDAGSEKFVEDEEDEDDGEEKKDDDRGPPTHIFAPQVLPPARTSYHSQTLSALV